MRSALVAIAIAAQLLVLVVMAGQRELIRETGARVHLRTAPVDPRDLFRGDYVRLAYELNRPGPAQLEGGLSFPAFRRGDKVYARLRPGGEGVYELDTLSADKPHGGLFIAGRVTRDGSPDLRGGIGVKYGIEQFFVEQGRGRTFEQRRGGRDGVQIPLEMEVALGDSGVAVLRGYRWSRLGIQLEVLRQPTRQAPEPLSPAVRISLHNVSDAPLAIADLESACSLALVTASFSNESFEVVGRKCQEPLSTAVEVLQPGESRSAEIDFHESLWAVRKPSDGSVDEIGKTAPRQRFRLVYSPPAALDDPLLWRGTLRTPAFSAGGRID